METLAKYPFLKPYFWSYSLESLAISSHKTLIIKQILNYGGEEATTWLRNTYSQADITEVIEASAKSEWTEKSLALWSLVYATSPKRTSRFA